MPAARPLPWYLSVLPAYVLIPLGVVVGAAVSLALPCDAAGLSCLGMPVMGGLVGAPLGALVAGLLGVRSGLRWWYAALLVLGVAALLALFLSAEDDARWWCAAAALVLPIAAGLVSSRGPGDWRRRATVAALLAALAVGGVVASRALSDAADARDAVADYRTSGLPLYAPVQATEYRYRLIGATTQAPGRGYALYELRKGGQPYAIVKTAAQAPYDDCTHALQARTLPDGLIVDAWGSSPKVCRVVGPATSVVVYAEHGSPTRTEAELVELMRSLQPVDTDWLAARG